MEDVVKQGTGTACQLENMTVAGKTGTTDAYNDLWFVGYTPYYTCAVWSGYDNNEKLPEDARNFHKNLWKKVMTRIHEGLPDKDFDMPASVEEISICSETGLLPRAGCPVITEYFDIGDVPTDYCDQHFYEEESIPEYNVEEETFEVSPTPDPGNTDGTNTGGDNTGGDNTGGDNTGGDNSGGDNTGGDNTGGDNGGGDNTGGDNSGGDNTGGDNTGGDNTGGDNGGGDNTGGDGGDGGGDAVA